MKIIADIDLGAVERRRRRLEMGIRDRGGDYVEDHVVIDGKLYKYRVTETYCFPLLGAPMKRDLTLKLIGMDDDDKEILEAMLSRRALYVYPGYRWDGASGPTKDTEDTMAGSLLHDTIYEMCRKEILPADKLRPRALIRVWADWQFLRILKEDGMIWARRKTWFLLVRKYAKYAAEPPREI